MRTLLALIAVLGALPAAAADIERYVSSEAGFAVNSWLLPTKHGLIVIDTQFTVSEADQLVAAIKKTGLPLRAIVVTHPHPDHYNGICQLLALRRVPVYATQATIDGIRATADAKRAQWKPTYGADYPDRTCVPDHAVTEKSVRIDGLELQFRGYGPGESLEESVILLPELRAAFVGDLIYNQVHPWLAEGRSLEWLKQLDRLQNDTPADWTVYPGHGAAAGVAVIDAQRRYITEFRTLVQAGAGKSRLSADASKRIVEVMKGRYPNWPLAMLITINADSIAKELD